MRSDEAGSAGDYYVSFHFIEVRFLHSLRSVEMTVATVSLG